MYLYFLVDMYDKHHTFFNCKYIKLVQFLYNKKSSQFLCEDFVYKLEKELLSAFLHRMIHVHHIIILQFFSNSFQHLTFRVLILFVTCGILSNPEDKISKPRDSNSFDSTKAFKRSVHNNSCFVSKDFFTPKSIISNSNSYILSFSWNSKITSMIKHKFNLFEFLKFHYIC